MATATIKLIEAVERLNMTGEIGDGMVANLHDLASMARLEVTPHLGFLEWATAQREGKAMKPWAGGQEPPTDWSGGAVRYADGTTSFARPETIHWDHANPHCSIQNRIVAYEPESPVERRTYDGWSIEHVTLAAVEPLPRGIGPGCGGEPYSGGGRLPMRHECNCMCHRSPAPLHVGPCCR